MIVDVVCRVKVSRLYIYVGGCEWTLFLYFFGHQNLTSELFLFTCVVGSNILHKAEGVTTIVKSQHSATCDCCVVGLTAYVGCLQIVIPEVELGVFFFFKLTIGAGRGHTFE